ncbi:Uncharacterized protein PCOAH_00044700 [Plasmodium coatneyi]|uniref:Uncharacterized protein n=1 Tax=Plasmodium coatneyi TaxID=208452 RepID=A0A1B1E6J9_9APIC|nr:Uncharacterized protein PCOAH_00044700 [Plasmodium coatneyi]ANQ10389.1 Uncharacterized protein PCOAH_00044700 [Plasmodium coatneyi]
MRIANVQRSGKTCVELVIARLCRGKAAAAEYDFTVSLRKNGNRNYSITRHQQSASRGSQKEEGMSCAQHEKEIRDAALQTVSRSLSEKTKQQTNLHSYTDACEEVRERRIRESLKKYNLFNVYLDKIRKAPGQNKKKQKIININSVKHYDQYVHMFDVDSLLIYANNKFKIYKRKKKFPGNEDFFAHFVKIYIQLNVILRDFFSHHGEINCGEYFTNIFKTYLQNIPSVKRVTKNKNKYDETFFFKILQLVKIFNQVKFFKTLKGGTTLHLERILAFPPGTGKGKIPKQEELNSFPNVDHHKLFYEYMTCNYDEDTDKEIFDAQNDINFVKNLNIFGDKLEEITGVDDSESSFFRMKGPIREGLAYPGGEENMDSSPHYINEDLRNLRISSISPVNYSHVGVNDPQSEIIATNKFTFPIVETVHDKLNNHRSIDHVSFAKAFIHLLKNLIKHLHDDGVVRLFILCSNMFDTEWDDKEVLSFYTEMYKRIHRMKNISNKNIAYILSACSNYSLKEENTLLLEKIKRDILSNSRCGKAGRKSYLNIYNVTPSHLENIIYTFAKHRIREKNLFTLLSEIVKEKFHGFSCITTINILNSYTILNYEALVFDFLYARIKTFDFLSFMMCRGKNVIKLMNTLLLIEGRNCGSVRAAEKVTFVTVADGSVKHSASLTDQEVYTALMSALLYELKTFKGGGTHCSNASKESDEHDQSSNDAHRTCALTGEYAIRSIYKKLLRLKIISVQNKSDLAFLRSILKRTYGKLDIDQLDNFFVFSFINLNLKKINFHKLVYTLLTYNNLIGGKRLLNNYTQTKTKFI